MVSTLSSSKRSRTIVNAVVLPIPAFAVEDIPRSPKFLRPLV